MLIPPAAALLSRLLKLGAFCSALIVAWRATLEVYAVAGLTGRWLFGLSMKWAGMFFAFELLLIFTLIAIVIFLWFPDQLVFISRHLTAWRQAAARWTWVPVAALLAMIAWLFFFSRWAVFFPGAYLRWVVLFWASVISAFLLTRDEHILVRPGMFMVALSGVGVWFDILAEFARVTDYPFSLFWSEGNRFYDYSLVFGQELYDYAGTIVNPYASPGRYALWGLPFLLPGLPITAHRIWDAVLYTAPLLLGSWMLFRGTPNRSLRWSLIFLAFLFLNQGPIYPHFLIPALIATAFTFTEKPLPRGLAIFVASLLAGLSRWTWAVGPGTWGALSDLLLYYPKRQGNLIRRLLPTALSALIGSLPGIALTLFNSSTSVNAGLSVQQPLLWYRLWPNATYPPGIVLGITIATTPWLILLFWLVGTRRIQLDWFQALAVFGSLSALLLAGVVISTKIGGGSNLHNFDLFLFTLVFVGALLVRAQRTGLQIQAWPKLTQGLLYTALALLVCQAPLLHNIQVAAYDTEVDRFRRAMRARVTPQDELEKTPPALVPYLNAVLHGNVTILPSPETSAAVLTSIQAQVEAARGRGEVLFIDQRQLLTFGYIRGIPFVPEFEKKYMMDQAMAGYAPYFQAYYRDLAAQRFSLIVSDILKVNYLAGQADRTFSEENDAWVTWVSAPTLCFYEPYTEFTAYNIMLLVPRQNPTDCARYLQP